MFCSVLCREVNRRVAAYGLTLYQYKQLLVSQRSACAVCGCGEIKWKTDLRRDGWHIDHDHETGAVRGILCPPCNLMIGYAKDRPHVLIAAAEYLTR